MRGPHNNNNGTIFCTKRVNKESTLAAYRPNETTKMGLTIHLNVDLVR
jgi:hypothetical protein